MGATSVESREMQPAFAQLRRGPGMKDWGLDHRSDCPRHSSILATQVGRGHDRYGRVLPVVEWPQGGPLPVSNERPCSLFNEFRFVRKHQRRGAVIELWVHAQEPS